MKNNSSTKIALAVTLALSAGHSLTAANTELDVINGQVDLSLGSTFTQSNAPSVANDVTFINGPYAPTAFTVGDSNLTFGTLNDLSATAITLSNSTGSAGRAITLGGAAGTDSVVGSDPADLLYVATSSNLTATGGAGNTALGLVLGQSGNFNVAGNANLSTIISGGFAINKTGVGLLTLSGANTFTGGITINSGALNLGNAAGAGTGTITLAGTGSLVFANQNFGNGLNITGSNTIVNTADNADNSHTGALTGNGTLTVAQSLTVNGSTFNGASSFKWNGDLSGFTGTFVSNTNRNVIFIGNANNGSNAKWVINNNNATGAFVGSNAGTGGIFQMGELSGTGSAATIYANFNSATPTVYQIGALNTDSTFAGRFSNNGGGVTAINKIGTGTLTLSGQNTATGPNRVLAGTLQFAQQQSLFNSTTPTATSLVVNSGATAAFNVGGAGEFNATAIGAIAAVGSATGGFQAGSFMGLDTTNAVGGIFNYGTSLANTNGGANAFSLAKLGTGTLNLTGASSYTGATVVKSGTLLISGTGAINGSSGITVNGPTASLVQTSSTAGTAPVILTQGTLDGTGTAGPVTVASSLGNVVTNGAGSTGTLSLASLTLSGAATLNLNLGSTASTPAISVVGALSTLGGAGQVALNFTTAPIWANGTTYNLISYGSFSGANNNFTLGAVGGLGARQSATFGNTGAGSGFLTLSIAGDTPVWTGAQSTAWTTNTVGGASNWKLQTAGTATNFLNNDAVIFDDTATGTTALNISTANVNATSILFNNSSKDYTVGSTGGFGIAAGAITKNGSGTVTLASANTFSGNIALNAGVLRAGIASVANTSGAFGNNSAVTIANAAGTTLDINGFNTQIGSLSGGGANGGNVTLGSGSLTIGGNNASQSTYAGVISGTGGLTKIGTGTQTLSGANTYTGATSIVGGTLRVDGSIAAGSTVCVGTVGTLAGGGAVNGNAALTGGGVIRLDSTGTIAGTLSVTGGNWNGAGTVSGAVTSSSGTFTIGSNANLTAISGVNVTGGTLASATSTGTITGSVNYTSGSNSAFGGVIAGDGNTLTINNAAATVTLSGNSTYSGGTSIIAGQAILNSATGFGSGAVNVSSGAGVSTGVNALIPNSFSGSGTVTINGTTGSTTFGNAAAFNNFTGTLNVNSTGGNKLGLVTAGQTIGSGATVNVTAGATLFVANNSTLSGVTFNVTGDGNGEGLGALRLEGGLNIDSQSAVHLLGNTSLGGNGQSVIDAVISGLGFGITKVASGTMTLTGTNTYTGTTTVNNGTLLVSGTGTLGTGNVTVANSATAILSLQSTVSFSDSAILNFGSNSVINVGFFGDDMLGGITNTTTLLSIAPGTYTPAQLNDFFGVTSFVDNSGFATLTVVPEPGTWVMLLGGLGMVVLMRRPRVS